MLNIQKITFAPKNILFANDSETRMYDLEVYKKHLVAFCQNQLGGEFDFEKWGISALRSALSDLTTLNDFDHVFTEQLEGLQFFAGKSKIKELKNLKPQQIGFYPNGTEYQYSTETIIFENGVKGRYFRNYKAQKYRPQIGDEFNLQMDTKAVLIPFSLEYKYYKNINLMDKKPLNYTGKKSIYKAKEIEVVVY